MEDLELELEDLFEGLTNDGEIETDYDVAGVLRTIQKLEKKLYAQQKYADHIKEKLDVGINKTKQSILAYRESIKLYMKTSNKNKLSFDDVGTVSLTNIGKTELVVDNEEAVIEYIKTNGLQNLLKVQETIAKAELNKYLKDNPDVPGIVEQPKDIGFQIKFK